MGDGRARLRRGDGGGRRPTSWVEVERAVLLRLAADIYRPGARLPTCEQMAAELGANKNTVSKAYRALGERGYLRTVVGRGTFVARRPARRDPGVAIADVRSLLGLVVQEAKLAGIDLDRFRELVEETAARYYAGAVTRVGFVECNPLDAATLSRDLQAALGHPVEPLLLDEVMADPTRFLDEFDVLAVNLSHLSALEAALPATRRSGSAEIVALLLLPDPESLTQVARLRPGQQLGIVCDLEGTLEVLSGLVRACNPGVRLSGCLSSDDSALRRVVDQADVILVTHSARERLTALQPRAPLIGVAFKVDERSVQQLAARIAEGARPGLRAAS